MLATKYRALAFAVFRVFFGRRANLVRKLNQVGKIAYLALMLPVEAAGDVVFFCKRFRQPKDLRPRKVLIVKPDQLGDVLFSTFMLPIIAERHPGAEIHYLINEKTGVVLARNPYVKRTFVWHDPVLLLLFGREKRAKSRFVHLMRENLRVFRQLRAERYDVVINARPVAPSVNLPWRFLGATLIAFDTSEQSFLADAWAPWDFHEEEWLNYLGLLRPLGIAGPQEFRSVFENVDEALADDASLFPPGKEVVAIAPVTYDTDKQWSDAGWRAAISLMTGAGYRVVLTGLASQTRYLESLAAGTDALVLTSANIPQLAGIYRKARLFMGIDSFPAHLALAVRLRGACFVNGENYFLKGHTRGRLVNGTCLMPLHESMRIFATWATPEEVLAWLREELAVR